MDKNKIKKFAVEARESLIDSVTTALYGYGISADEIKPELEISTQDTKYYLNEKTPVVGKQITWRQDIVNELRLRGYDEDKKQVFNDFVEEVAYTWFNRIIAIRFMEVNNYLPTRVRVLSNESGKNEPEIIEQALSLENDLGGYSKEEKQLIEEALTTQDPALYDKLYPILFIKQINALTKILPGLFERTQDYMQLLFTPSYTRGVIKDLVSEIAEDYFNVKTDDTEDNIGEVQIIGWIYQYYNTEPKDKAFKKKKYETSDIPAVTQLFTPNWIVKYMVENSLGRYWIDILHSRGEARSEKEIAEDYNWQYYMPASDKNEVVDDDELKNKDITDIKFIDPSSGSGHVLDYAFDVFMQIYETEGYSKREAAKLIVENNLYGLDIDTRAYQLSYFSIMMKAREYNRRIFKNGKIKANIYDVPEIHYEASDYEEFLQDSTIKDKDAARDTLKKLIELFRVGNDLGSIIKIDPSWDLDELEELTYWPAGTLIQIDLLGDAEEKHDELRAVLEVAKVLQKNFDVGVTNPPYMGGGKMDAPLKKYVQNNYPDSKADMFAVFIEVLINMVNDNGYVGMVTQHSWMFLSNFEKLRKKLQQNTIINMSHLGTRAFEEIGGEVVQTTAFILQGKKRDGYVGSYERLVDYGSQDVKDKQFLKIQSDEDTKDLYQVSQTNFDKIPGSPIAYWASENIYKDFDKGLPLNNIIHSFQGIITGNNKYYLRNWFEISNNKLLLKLNNQQKYFDYNNIWIPYNKGGTYRKWYGNNDYVLRWIDNGRGLTRSRSENKKYYFKEGITWSFLSANNFSCRYFSEGYLWDVSGSSLFTSKKYLNLILGYLNSKVAKYLLNMLNPTMNYQVMNIIALPFILSDNSETTIQTNISLSKKDWDAFETSWDFKKSPLLGSNKAAFLKESYNNWEKEAEDRFNQLKSNEEELNKIFIDLYGLQDELTPEEEDKDVSVRKADQVRDIKAFLSYFIGCIFGRYSLDEDGLAYAGGEWNSNKYKTFKPNKDNIILLTDQKYFDDERDIIVRLKEFLAKTFDTDKVSENMDFIARTLDPKKFEKGTSSEEIIRTYFIKDFYKDHAKIYQKRPIYWEFNSGRSNGFKALMYLHRYSHDELAMVRNYLHQLEPEMASLVEVDEKLLENETMAGAKSTYRRTIKNINKQLAEMTKYDQVLEHLSQSQIELDLDDGVLENHKKLQQGEKILSKL